MHFTQQFASDVTAAAAAAGTELRIHGCNTSQQHGAIFYSLSSERVKWAEEGINLDLMEEHVKYFSVQSNARSQMKLGSITVPMEVAQMHILPVQFALEA